MSLTANTSIHTLLLADIPCDESLVCFETYAFSHTVNARHSLELLLVIVLLPYVWRSCSFGSAGLIPSRAPVDHRGVDIGVGQPSILPLLACIIAASISPQFSLILTTRMNYFYLTVFCQNS